MRIEPLGDRVVIKRLEATEVTAGGIYLPDASRERPREGRVLAVGPGRLNSQGERQTLQVSEGDRVLFSSYSGTEIEIDGQDVLIMGEPEILAILA